jgi:hypothetical protein
LTIPSTRTLNTFYAPHHAEQAIRRADFEVFIPVPSTNINNNAIHPIPKNRLWKELIPRERQDVREHVVAILSNNSRFSVRFVVAVITMLANIDSLSDGLSGKIAIG